MKNRKIAVSLYIMQTGMKRVFYSLPVLIFLLLSCKKDAEVPPSMPSPEEPLPNTVVRIQVKNMVDTMPLYLDTVKYLLDNGDKLKVTNYKYYISNIQLLRADSTFYAEPESYHLVSQLDSNSLAIAIRHVPEGDYTSIRFMIGVDSTRNVSGVQGGDLNPALGMFWTWNTGYIMAKVEGTSQQSTMMNGMVAYHIGGFKGNYSALKTVTLSFNGSHALVTESHSPVIHLKSDLAQWFKSPNSIGIANINNVTIVGPTSRMIADNYADMFSVTGIYY
jgi:hypothetical protein